MKSVFSLILILLTLFVYLSRAQNTTDNSTTTISTNDAKDLLNGSGFFKNSLPDKWFMNSSALSYELQMFNNTEYYYLILEKNSTAQLSFNDGLILSFNLTQPKHVRFYFAPSFVDNENTNLRLKNSKIDKTALSFRCGNAGFLRVNDNQMVDFYNSTISNKTHVIWNKMDLILNWEDQEVRIYLNDTFKGTSGFYHPEATEVDTLMLYNLKPGTTSFWRNLEVCDKECQGFSYGGKIKVGIFMILIALACIF